MLFRIAGILVPCAVALANPVAAQSPTPPPAAITRTVIATTKLPTVTEAPLHFRAVSVTLPPNDTSSVSAANGILYQLSGSTEVSVDDQPRTLNTGEGLFIASKPALHQRRDNAYQRRARMGVCATTAVLGHLEIARIDGRGPAAPGTWDPPVETCGSGWRSTQLQSPLIS